MKFIGDFHIHSHFSIATSKKLIPEYLDQWARIKGITVVGTGDFTHPGWTAELKEKLEPAEEGLFKLKPGVALDPSLTYSNLDPRPVRFMLTAEISNIYKRDGKTRKVHNLVFKAASIFSKCPSIILSIMMTSWFSETNASTK